MAPRLRFSSDLRTFHSLQQYVRRDTLDIFDQLDQDDDITGIIRSYTNGKDELLHAMFLHDRFHIGDEIRPDRWAVRVDPRLAVGPQMDGVWYTTPAGEDRKTVCEVREEAAWHQYTDLDGFVVPLYLLEEMRIVEGKTEEEWDARGVAVSDKGWELVKAWKATLVN